MTGMPKRIQLRRSKGWRKPEGAIVVSRPSKFGNPFIPLDCRDAGYQGTDEEIRARCVDAFRVWLTSRDWKLNWDGEESARRRQLILDSMEELRGHDLCCWCPLDQPCHADVLLEIGNKEEFVQ